MDGNNEVMYAMASKITFICQMDFNAFPVDIQVYTKLKCEISKHFPSFPFTKSVPLLCERDKYPRSHLPPNKEFFS